MSPAERAALALTALPFLTLALAHFALRRLKVTSGMNLAVAAFLMLRQIGRLAGLVSTLIGAIWLAGMKLDPEAYAAFKAEPRSVLVIMGSAALAYLYLFVRWCWQMWRSRRKPQEYAP